MAKNSELLETLPETALETALETLEAWLDTPPSERPALDSRELATLKTALEILGDLITNTPISN